MSVLNKPLPDIVVWSDPIPCARCGVRFVIPESLEKKRRSDGNEFYCPNGHSLSYRDSEVTRLRLELEREKQRAAAKQEAIKMKNRQLAAERRSHSATRGHLTRQKRRAAAGVCPCCNRSFKQLAAHMKTKHPEYLA